MTNFEKIKGMNFEELTEFIEDFVRTSKHEEIIADFCGKFCEHRNIDKDECECECECPYIDTFDIAWWLNQEADAHD